jgi:hypothetical protein
MPQVALSAVPAARTDWESMTAAVGWGLHLCVPENFVHVMRPGDIR